MEDPEEIELIPLGESSTEGSPPESNFAGFTQSTLDAFGAYWPGYKFIIDPIPLNSHFVDPEPVDHLFSHVHLLYHPHYPLLRFPIPNLRSYYLFGQLLQGRNEAGISSWNFGFENKLFSRTWKESGEPSVSKYAFRGDLDQKRESIMAHLFVLMKCSEAQICKVYETARDACRTEVSAEFLESMKEFFPITNANTPAQFQITYVQDRWTPLATFIRDPIIRRFLNHVTVNNLLERASRKDAVKLLKEVDIRLRDELASTLINLQALFDHDTPSAATDSEKTPSEAAHHEQVPIIDEELEGGNAQLKTSKTSAKKKKKSTKRKKQVTDEALPQEDQLTAEPSVPEVTITATLVNDLPGAVLDPRSTAKFSTPLNKTASDTCITGSLSTVQYFEACSPQQSSNARSNLDVARTSTDIPDTGASSSEGAEARITNLTELEISKETLHAQDKIKIATSTEESKWLMLTPEDLKPVVVPGSFIAPPGPYSSLSLAPVELEPIVVPGSFIASSKSDTALSLELTPDVVSPNSDSSFRPELGTSAKATTVPKKPGKTSHKKKSKAQGVSPTTDGITKGSSLPVSNDSSVQTSHNSAATKTSSPAASTSVDAAESSTLAIISKPEDFNQGPGKWSDEMDLEEALRQFPNLLEPTNLSGKADTNEVPTKFNDSDSGWTVVKSAPKKVKKPVVEGSVMQGARNAAPKGLCIGSNYRMTKKTETLQKPTSVPLSTTNTWTTSTKIDTSQVQKFQLVASKPSIISAAQALSDVPLPFGLSISKKRGKKVANKLSSHESPVDQAASKSGIVEVKSPAILASDFSQSMTATLPEINHPTQVTSETAPKQASSPIKAFIAEPESSQTAPVALSDATRVIDLSPESHTSEVFVTQPTTKHHPSSLVGVLVKAGVEVSALSSLITEASTAMPRSPVMEKLDHNQTQGDLGSEPTKVASTATDVKSDHQNGVKSVLSYDFSSNQVVQTPAASIVTRDNPFCAEQNGAVTEDRAATENRVAKNTHVAESLQAEESFSSNVIPAEQPTIDLGEYQEWVTRPSVRTWDDKDAYVYLGDICPPGLTLADHPELNKISKPGFMFKCAYCQQEMPEHLKKEKDVVCPGCGPCSEVRYCQKSHLLADTLEHQKVCGDESGKFPVLIHMLPDHYKTLYPYIKSINGSMTPEAFRQMAYSMIVKSDGEIENPFIAFYNFKMSNKGKKRLAEYKSNVYQFQDSGNYYIFSSAPVTRGTATIMTLDIIEGGPLFNRARNALFLTNDPKLARFVYRKVKADVMLHPDKAFKAEVLLAFDIQFSHEFPQYDIGNAGAIGSSRLGYNIDVEWKDVKDIVEKYEKSHPILNIWLNPPKKINKAVQKTWGVGWSGQPEEEWMVQLNREFHLIMEFTLKHGRTPAQQLEWIAQMKEQVYGHGDVEDEAEREMLKREIVLQEEELDKDLEDRRHEERMIRIKAHLADPAVRLIWRQEDAARAERQAIARAQYQ